MNQRIGFIGLGNLGSAMARRLREQGLSLVVWNRTRQKVAAVQHATGSAAASLTIASSPADLASKCDVIFLNLFDSKAVNEVLTGKAGILESDCRGKIIVDTTTNHFAQVASFYDLTERAGGSYLEAPVLGSVIPASQGNLTMLVSGDEQAFAAVKPLVEKLAKTIFYLEKRTLATRMKLINNLVLGAFMATIAEATVFGEGAGMERKQVLEILAAGAGNSGVLNAKRQKLIDSDFAPHFAVGAIHKDLEYVKEMAEDLNLNPQMAEAARRLFEAAELAGLKDSDLSAVIQAIGKH